MRLPDTSSAAWSAAQASEAAPYFDYDWIIRVAQAYNILDAYERLRDQFLDSMSLVTVKMSSGVHPLEVRDEVFYAAAVCPWLRRRTSQCKRR